MEERGIERRKDYDLKNNRVVKQNIEKKTAEQLSSKWKSNSLYGEFHKKMTSPNLATEESIRWIKSGTLRGGTLALIIAA